MGIYLIRCERISTSSTIYTLAAILFALCLWYQVLLIKAVARQLIILSYLKIPQDWLDDETRSLLSLDPGTSTSSKIHQSAAIKTNISNNPQTNPLLQAGLTIPDDREDHDEDDNSSTNRKSMALRDRRTSSSESSKSFLSNLDSRYVYTLKLSLLFVYNLLIIIVKCLLLLLKKICNYFVRHLNL